MRQGDFSKTAKMRFKSAAIGWLDMLGRLEPAEILATTSLKLITEYVDYMDQERGLSKTTINFSNKGTRQIHVKMQHKLYRK
jgi:hypothetical protein